MQTTLDTFIFGSETYPRYFIFDWCKKRAYFDFKNPNPKTVSSIHFVKKVRDTHFGFVNVILVNKPIDVNERGSILSFNWNELDKLEQQIEDKHKVIRNVAILKSSLQKMIRRMNPILALRSAYTLLHLKPAVFLRRLLVIMVEDSYIHSFFTEICWYMMACTNYELDMEDVDYLMNMVYTLSKCEMHRSFRANTNGNKNIQIMIKEMKKRMDESVDIDSDFMNRMSLIIAIYFREQYGGLEGDLHMLDNLRNCLFDNNKHSVFIIDKLISLALEDDGNDNVSRDESYRFLILNDIDISAIDFHCCPEMVGFIQKKLPKMPDYMIKQIMWRQSSGINYRKKSKDKSEKQMNEEKVWNDDIKPIWISWLRENSKRVIEGY